MTSAIPFFSASAKFRIGPSHQPSRPVISSSNAMPTLLLRFAAIPYWRPTTTASMPRLKAIGCAMMIEAVAIPTNAPITVGTIVRASSR